MEPTSADTWWNNDLTSNRRMYDSEIFERITNEQSEWLTTQMDDTIRQRLLDDLYVSARATESVSLTPSGARGLQGPQGIDLNEVPYYSDRQPNNIFEAGGTEKLYITNTGNMNGAIEFHPETNEIHIYSRPEHKIAKIKINVDSAGNFNTISVNDELIHQKTISDNERGNLDDSSVSYGTSPVDLQNLI